MRIGSDTGGTFTDLVTERGRVVKVLSTPEDPTEAVRAGIRALRLRRLDLLAHGTTVATNALLEGDLASTALVTTKGFADVIEIARQDRPRLYDQWADRPPPLVDRSLRLEVDERLDATGQELEPVGEVPEIPATATAVAVCLLHADLDPAHEADVAAELRARGLDVSASHEVSPEFREYERTVTTVVNAGLGPVCRRLPRGAGAAGHSGPGDDLGRGPGPGGRRRPDPGRVAPVRPRRRGAGRRGLRPRRRVPRRGDLRHGRHQHRRSPGAGRRAPAGRRAGGGRLPDPAGLGRRAHDRGRRGLHRRGGRRWGADGGPPFGGGSPGAGLLRARWAGADRHRRRPRRRPHPGRRSASRRWASWTGTPPPQPSRDSAWGRRRPRPTGWWRWWTP